MQTVEDAAAHRNHCRRLECTSVAMVGAQRRLEAPTPEPRCRGCCHAPAVELLALSSTASSAQEVHSMMKNLGQPWIGQTDLHGEHFTT